MGEDLHSFSLCVGEFPIALQYQRPEQSDSVANLYTEYRTAGLTGLYTGRNRQGNLKLGVRQQRCWDRLVTPTVPNFNWWFINILTFTHKLHQQDNRHI